MKHGQGRATKFLITASIAGLMATGFSGSAAAQDRADEEAENNVIVVTAQKRSEDVQDVPISIAVFSAESLEEANVDTILELTPVAPNFQARQSQQFATTTLRVRGIGGLDQDLVLEY